jgi:predicted nuclease with TOPRIM domain
VSSVAIIKRWTFIIAENAIVHYQRRYLQLDQERKHVQKNYGQYKNNVMPEIKDLSPEEITELKELSDRYSNMIKELGEKYLEIHELEEKLVELNTEKKLLFKDYAVLKDKNQELTTRLIDKYGEGRINLETGKIELF